jgi:kynurenine formamidase
MKLKTITVGLALVAAAFLWAQRHNPAPLPPQFSAVIDLTHALGERTPTYDVADKFEARTTATYEKQGYFMRTVCLPEHFGTHLDAPAHFARGRWTVDQIPPERLIAPLVIIDVSHKAAGNPDYLVSTDDVAMWEQVNGRVPPGAVVIARTGWDARWNTPDKYRNADAKGVLHFPGWSEEAVRFLVEGRDIFGLGIDTLSVDPGPSKDFPVHKYTSVHSVYHLENVANLGRAPEAGAIALVAPIKLQGGSGGPVRLMALVK